MKVHLKTRMLVVGKGSNQGKNGVTYYNLAVCNDNGEAGTLSIDVDAFDQVEPMKQHDLLCDYEDRGSYKVFRVVAAFPVNQK